MQEINKRVAFASAKRLGYCGAQTQTARGYFTSSLFYVLS